MRRDVRLPFFFGAFGRRPHAGYRQAKLL